jgi:hypothetical protein
MLNILDELAVYNSGLSSLAYIIGVIGFIPAVITFLRKTQTEIKEKEEKIYNEIAEEYFRFNQMVFDHPTLGVSWFQSFPTKNLTTEEKIQQAILFDILTALFEKTFLAYQGASSRQKRHQWMGWEMFIEDYCKKADYQIWYKNVVKGREDSLGAQYDKNFEIFMKSKFVNLTNN